MDATHVYCIAHADKAPPPCRATREQLKSVQILLPENQGQNLSLTVLYVSYSRVLQPKRPCRQVTPTLPGTLSIWAHQFGDPGPFSPPKLTDLYRVG